MDVYLMKPVILDMITKFCEKNCHFLQIYDSNKKFGVIKKTCELCKAIYSDKRNIIIQFFVFENEIAEITESIMAGQYGLR